MGGGGGVQRIEGTGLYGVVLDAVGMGRTYCTQEFETGREITIKFALLSIAISDFMCTYMHVPACVCVCVCVCAHVCVVFAGSREHLPHP